MNLIIVESPTKARTLTRFLGKEYDIEATMGHVKDLPKSKLGVDVEKNFEPQYVLLEKKKETIEKIEKKAKDAKEIFLATDPDREGEAIAYHVREILGDKDTKILRKNRKVSQCPSIPVSRISFHEITKEAVEEAIAHPRNIDKHLVDAQIARRVLDRLVGYTLSPLLWRKVRRGLSAGRVQSVAVRLIVEKEKEIERFKPEEYWEIFAQVVQVAKVKQVEKNSFVVQLIKIDEKKAEIKNGEDAKKIVGELEKAGYKVFDVKKREVKKNPYPPFSTSTMTQSAARLFGWSAKKTMSTAQVLYEEGLITYHRTDSFNLSKPAVTKARSFIQKSYGDQYLPEEARIYKTRSKVAQEAHEAIRPTKVSVEPKGEIGISGKFANEAKRLYELIWRRFVACQMPASVYDETTIEVEALRLAPLAQGKQINYLLRASGQTMKFDGWRKVIPSRPDGTDSVTLPEVVKDEPLSLIKVDPQQKFTQPPARFNEASLIKTLEALGIGRPSTYAPIISTIQLRQYVTKEEGKFKPTHVGVAVSDFLMKNFPGIVDYGFTKEMEDDLDDIAKGDSKWVEVMKNFYKPYEKKLKDVTENSQRVKIETEKLGKKCPKCKDARLAGDKSRQGELVVRIGRFGKFISCSNFPDCDYKEKYLEKVGMTCPKCGKGDVIVKKTGKGRAFFGCSRYPDCDWASWKNPKINLEKNGNIQQKS